MSGLEVLAIPALVASVISAFSGATSLYRSWRKDRKERSEKAENLDLQSLVSTSGSRVQEEYDVDFRRMGQRFAEGDDISRWALAQQVMTLQATVIRLLSNGSSTTAASALLHPYHSELTFHTTSARDTSVRALGELFQRKAQAAPLGRGLRQESSRQMLGEQRHNSSIEVQAERRYRTSKPRRRSVYARDGNRFGEHAAGELSSDHGGGSVDEYPEREPDHKERVMTLRPKDSLQFLKDARSTRQNPVGSRTKGPSDTEHNTAIFSDDCEGANSSDDEWIKTSVKVGFKPTSSIIPRGYASIDSMPTEKNSMPVYTRRIPFGSRTADDEVAETMNISHTSGRNFSNRAPKKLAKQNRKMSRFRYDVVESDGRVSPNSGQAGEVLGRRTSLTPQPLDLCDGVPWSAADRRMTQDPTMLLLTSSGKRPSNAEEARHRRAVVELSDSDASGNSELGVVKGLGDFLTVNGGRKTATVKDASHNDKTAISFTSQQRNAGYNCFGIFKRRSILVNRLQCAKCPFQCPFPATGARRHDVKTKDERLLNLHCFYKRFHFHSTNASVQGRNKVASQMRCFICKNGEVYPCDAFAIREHIRNCHTWEEICGGACQLTTCGLTTCRSCGSRVRVDQKTGIVRCDCLLLVPRSRVMEPD